MKPIPTSLRLHAVLTAILGLLSIIAITTTAIFVTTVTTVSILILYEDEYASGSPSSHPVKATFSVFSALVSRILE